MCVCMSVWWYVCMYGWMYVYVCLHIYIYICMCIYIYICVCMGSLRWHQLECTSAPRVYSEDFAKAVLECWLAGCSSTPSKELQHFGKNSLGEKITLAIGGMHVTFHQSKNLLELYIQAQEITTCESYTNGGVDHCAKPSNVPSFETIP